MGNEFSSSLMRLRFLRSSGRLAQAGAITALVRKSFLLVLLLLSVTAHGDCVIMLHGLARTANSMDDMAEAFRASGYQTVNLDYPDNQYPIEELAPMAIDEALKHCPEQQTVHFVTHSLGGILVRYYLEHHELENLGRVVMMAPPNQGSQVADALEVNPLYQLINGPAGNQLGTEEDDLVTQLGSVDFPLGIIAGTRTVNPLLSQLLPNPDDGKVAVENTRVEGMTALLEVPHSHTFMMHAEDVINQSLHFIEHGKFLDVPEGSRMINLP